MTPLFLDYTIGSYLAAPLHINERISVRPHFENSPLP